MVCILPEDGWAGKSPFGLDASTGCRAATIQRSRAVRGEADSARPATR
jgi:hypothetical protein